ncbi:MAG: hypothetical protein HY336_02740 [Candidatus Doudnabacteria bacterium]|nr:hypothetical protein [Candidatus Doudnabacteria bacterium]
MSTQLLPCDRKLKQFLREKGVLKDIEKQELRRFKRIVFVVCSDGQQIWDVMLHTFMNMIGRVRLYLLINFMMIPGRLRSFMAPTMEAVHQRISFSGIEPVLHVLADNGGPMMMVEGSRTLPPNSTRPKDFIWSIGGGRKLKNPIYYIVLCAHFGCGAAVDAGYDAVDILDHLVRAYQNVKEAYPDDKIMTKLQVPFGRWLKRTYKFDVKQYLAMRDDVVVFYLELKREEEEQAKIKTKLATA